MPHQNDVRLLTSLPFYKIPNPVDRRGASSFATLRDTPFYHRGCACRRLFNSEKSLPRATPAAFCQQISAHLCGAQGGCLHCQPPGAATTNLDRNAMLTPSGVRESSHAIQLAQSIEPNRANWQHRARPKFGARVPVTPLSYVVFAGPCDARMRRSPSRLNGSCWARISTNAKLGPCMRVGLWST